MTPTLTHLPLPQESDVHFLHIISNLLSPAECAAIIHEHTTSLIPHELTLTSRLREIFDDEDLADSLWKRLKPFYGSMRIVDEDGCNWTASRLNTRFRFAKYERGGAFEPHVDGRRLDTIDCQTFMTVNMYLNTVLPENGGATRILSPLATGNGDVKHDVLRKVQPVEGSAAVFRDSLYHDGEALGGGVKYLLRTDIMYARDEPFDLDVACTGLSSEEKGRKALEWAVRLEDGGNQDLAVTWYKKAFRLWPALGQSNE